jgi:hypothetical protein
MAGAACRDSRSGVFGDCMTTAFDAAPEMRSFFVRAGGILSGLVSCRMFRVSIFSAGKLLNDM